MVRNNRTLIDFIPKNNKWNIQTTEKNTSSFVDFDKNIPKSNNNYSSEYNTLNFIEKNSVRRGNVIPHVNQYDILIYKYRQELYLVVVTNIKDNIITFRELHFDIINNKLIFDLDKGKIFETKYKDINKLTSLKCPFLKWDTNPYISIFDISYSNKLFHANKRNIGDSFLCSISEKKPLANMTIKNIIYFKNSSCKIASHYLCDFNNQTKTISPFSRYIQYENDSIKIRNNVRNFREIYANSFKKFKYIDIEFYHLRKKQIHHLAKNHGKSIRESNCYLMNLIKNRTENHGKLNIKKSYHWWRKYIDKPEIERIVKSFAEKNFKINLEIPINEYAFINKFNEYENEFYEQVKSKYSTNNLQNSILKEHKFRKLILKSTIRIQNIWKKYYIKKEKNLGDFIEETGETILYNYIVA